MVSWVFMGLLETLWEPRKGQVPRLRQSGKMSLGRGP